MVMVKTELGVDGDTRIKLVKKNTQVRILFG
jgi:hypothetical protein